MKRLYFIFYIFSCLLLVYTDSSCSNSVSPKIVVLTCSYNNKSYYKESLTSLFNQSYQDWVCYYIDDASQDGTYELAYEFTALHGMLGKVHFIKNNQNLGAMANQYNIIRNCLDHQKIVILDGDDQFYDQDVLGYIDYVYSDPNVWLTYGTYEPSVKPFPVYCEDVSINKNIQDRYFFRKHPWVFSHLRTFYAGLFKKVKKEDLMYSNNFLKSVPDLAATLPMLEMANGSVKHYKYISKVLYIYNNVNPLCEFRIEGLEIGNMAHFIRNKDPYMPVENIF